MRLSHTLICAAVLLSAIGGPASAQYYRYPPGGRPPCAAVTPSPLGGAARGAAGGAVVGAIFGDAGRGAAIGAAESVASEPWSGAVMLDLPAIATDLLRPALRPSDRKNFGTKGVVMRRSALLLFPLAGPLCGLYAANTASAAGSRCAVASTPPQTAAAPPPAPVSGPMWNVTKITCAQMLSADDDDRAAGIMFCYGYLAASSGIKVIDVSMIDQNVRRVVEQCVKTPNLTVPQAYRVAFGIRPRRR